MADRTNPGAASGTDARPTLAPTPQPQGQEQQSQPADDAAAGQGSVREGASERGGEGGYGNDTGFATGTEAPRGDDPGESSDGDADGGTSQREQQTRDTYRDDGMR